MKQLFFILCISLAAVILSSCSDKDNTPASDELVGSVWSQTADGRTDTFYFALDRKCTITWQYEGSDPVKQECRYSYKSPHVTIETGVKTITGRIEGNVLSINIYDRDLALQRIR